MSLGVIPDILSFIKSGDFASVLQFLQTSGYLIIFLIVIVEGPIITYIAAFAASLGIFNVYYVFIVSVLGFVVGDIILFSIGRIGKRAVVEKYARNSKNLSRIDKLQIYLEKNPGKTISVIKLTPFFCVLGIIFVGSTNMSLKKFIRYSLIVTVSYSLVMTLLGFYSGVAFLLIAKYVKYVEYLILGTVILIVLVFFFFRFISKKVSGKIEKI